MICMKILLALLFIIVYHDGFQVNTSETERHVGSHEGRPDGRHEGRPDRRHEGRPDGRHEDRSDRRHEGRPDGGHEEKQQEKHEDTQSIHQVMQDKHQEMQDKHQERHDKHQQRQSIHHKFQTQPPQSLPAIHTPGNIRTGLFAATNVTYTLEYKCDPGSFISELTLNSTDLLDVTCDGYEITSNTWYFIATINGTKTVLAAKTRDQYSYINGNSLSYSNGKIESDICKDDLVSWVSMASADVQAGCDSRDRGLQSLTENYGYIAFAGKCFSNCGNPGATIVYNPPVNSWGAVTQANTQPQPAPPPGLGSFLACNGAKLACKVAKSKCNGNQQCSAAKIACDGVGLVCG